MSGLKRFFWDFLAEWEAWKRGFVLHLPGNLGVRVRYNFYKKRFGACGKGVVIHANVRFEAPEKLFLGNRVEISSGTVVSAGGTVRIGNDVGIGPGVGIWSTNHVFSDHAKPFLDQGYEYGEVLIGNDVWLGSGAILKPGLSIGDGCIVSGGSVLAKSLPPYSISGGNPARVLGWRKPPEKTEAAKEEA